MDLLRNLILKHSFRRLLTLLTAVGVFMLSLLASFALSWQSSLQMKDTLQSQGIQITQRLAEQSRLALLSGSPDNATAAIDATLSFPDVVAVEVIDANGKRLVRRFKQTDTQWASGDVPLAARHDTAALQYETTEHWCFVAPVRTADVEASPFDATERRDTYLGQVRVLQDTTTLRHLRASLFLANFAYSMLFALVFLGLLSLLARRLTTPLAQLSRNMLRAERGERDLQASVEGPTDIADMARAFNSMMAQLGEREAELIRSRDEAVSLARLKSQFAATVSHEIRTPLNGVIGTLDLLVGSRLSARQRHFLELAWDSAQYLLDLVNNILDLSRLEAGAAGLERKPLRLREMVEGVIDTLTPQAHRKGLEIGYAISPDCAIEVLADGRKLRQVLTNLVANAVKFTEYGEISVRLRTERLPERSMLRFEVTDTGPGVPADYADRIFESFVQVDPQPNRQNQGSGLGLAISRQLVALMDGRIGVETPAEGGSRFWFELPIEITAEVIPPAYAPPVTRRLLVIDAAAIVREFFDNALQAHGWHTECVTGSAQALHRVQHASPPGTSFDAVLIDGQLAATEPLPLEQLRKLLPATTRWLLMTPFIQRSDAVPEFMTSVIGKPLRLHRLRAALDALFEPQQSALDLPLPTPSSGASLFNVLVVEDNRTNQIVVRSMLSGLGSQVTLAINGEEAIAAFGRERWDAILMDCSMPGMDGFEATARIRGTEAPQGGRVPIIAMTANTSLTDIEKCLAAGMDDHLPKPFTQEELRAVLRRWLPAQLLTGSGHALAGDEGGPEEHANHPLDSATLDRLRDALGGALGEAITPFLEDMPEHLAAIRRAILGPNLAELRHHTHTLAGAAGNLGARRLQSLAEQLQSAPPDSERMGDLLQQVQAEFERVDSALRLTLSDLAAPPTAVAPASSTVLIADDDRSTRSALRYALQLKGYQVVEAVDGAAALALLERKLPDVVLMDAMMPGMDGFATCARMKELPQARDIPVLMITALDDRHSIEQAYAAGATDYITKPLHLNAVVQRVGRAIEALHTERHVRHLAYNDMLTGLPNRALFGDLLRQQIDRARQTHTAVAVLFLDLDRFKFVNDSLGHESGDKLLKAVAERLRQCVRVGDHVARLGGDEFTVVLEELASTPAAAIAADKIAKALSEPFHIEGHDVFISASIGISLFPRDGEDVSTLLRHADTAMYEAKRANRGHQFYEPGMEVSVSEHLLLEGALRRALERGELSLHYQPEICARDGELCGAEALLRWQHPTRGAVSPAEFIPLAEETGLINPIGDWALREACLQWTQWQARIRPEARLSINLSGKQLLAADFASRVETILSETGLPPQRLVFEITESVWMEQATEGLSTLHRLKNLGIRLAIDDFGTGYSSLSYLKRLPVDILKVDRAFVRDIAHSPADRAIVQGIMALAHSLGLEVIAEGVEHEAQRAVLVELGCDHLQGYLFSRPVDGLAFSQQILQTVDKA